MPPVTPGCGADLQAQHPQIRSTSSQWRIMQSHHIVVGISTLMATALMHSESWVMQTPDSRPHKNNTQIKHFQSQYGSRGLSSPLAWRHDAQTHEKRCNSSYESCITRHLGMQIPHIFTCLRVTHNPLAVECGSRWDF